MGPVVLVPRRPEPWRDALWRFVRREVEEETGWPIFEGLSVDGPFNRSRALNEAAREAGGWEVAVILDADTVPDFRRLKLAAEYARADALFCAQSRLASLTKEATREVLAGDADVEGAARRWTYNNPKSSCLAVGRALWDSVGGFDERFEGWGFEDAAFYHACQAFQAAKRLDGDAFHLWHPRSPEKDKNSPQYQANQALGERYKAARHDPRSMREILGEPGGPAEGCGYA